MTNRATVRHVSERVYCSSTGHYGADVTIERAGKMAYYVYDFNGSLLWHGKRDWRERPCPKYLEAAILEQLRDLYIKNQIKVYEHDRDGNQRYDNLRYHDRRSFEWVIGIRQAENKAL